MSESTTMNDMIYWCFFNTNLDCWPWCKACVLWFYEVDTATVLGLQIRCYGCSLPHQIKYADMASAFPHQLYRQFYAGPFHMLILMFTSQK